MSELFILDLLLHTGKVGRVPTEPPIWKCLFSGVYLVRISGVDTDVGRDAERAA